MLQAPQTPHVGGHLGTSTCARRLLRQLTPSRWPWAARAATPTPSTSRRTPRCWAAAAAAAPAPAPARWPSRLHRPGSVSTRTSRADDLSLSETRLLHCEHRTVTEIREGAVAAVTISEVAGFCEGWAPVPQVVITGLLMSTPASANTRCSSSGFRYLNRPTNVVSGLSNVSHCGSCAMDRAWATAALMQCAGDCRLQSGRDLHSPLRTCLSSL